MGCAESRPEAASQPLLSDSDTRAFTSHSMPVLSRMGQPPSQNNPGDPVLLSTQHERLILELLPFKEVRQFHE